MKKITLFLVLAGCTTMSHREQIVANGIDEVGATCMLKVFKNMRLLYDCQDGPDFYPAVRTCFREKPDSVKFWSREIFKCSCE